MNEWIDDLDKLYSYIGWVVLIELKTKHYSEVANYKIISHDPDMTNKWYSQTMKEIDESSIKRFLPLTKRTH